MLLSQCTIKQKQSEKQIFSFRNKNNSVGSQKSETLTFHSVTISIYIYIHNYMSNKLECEVFYF